MTNSKPYSDRKRHFMLELILTLQRRTNWPGDSEDRSEKYEVMILVPETLPEELKDRVEYAVQVIAHRMVQEGLPVISRNSSHNGRQSSSSS